MVPTAANCPVCGAPCAGREPICDNCGFVFASRSASASPAHAAFPGYTQLQPGQLLSRGRYSVLRALSKGGMGAIYLATDHETFGRTVVVKAMLDYFDVADPLAAQAARQRFIHEARTLAALRHPAIPQILGYFQDGAQNYIVMEYIEGHDLLQRLTHRSEGRGGRRIAGRAYARSDVLRWGVTLCRVLEYLSSGMPHPVVHHDIKPANLLLDSSSGDVRLVDFGTARARLLAQAGGKGVRQSSLYGTQGYAAPEQYGGQSEPRSDVYALAATLYHLATDDDPCDHPFDFPHLRGLGAFGQVLASALAPSADKRPSAAELRRRLEDLHARPAAPAPPPRTQSPLQAPDGTALHSIVELSRWCETHWHVGADWLYGTLPSLVATTWGRAALAQQLQDIVDQHRTSHSAGLDAALALLDPDGFGKARSQVIAAAQALEFGALLAREACEQQLLLANSGRRHVDASLALPGWISASHSRISLPPGEQLAIDLCAEGWRAPNSGPLHGSLAVRAGATRLLKVETWAEAPRWSPASQRARPWLLSTIAAFSLGAILLWALSPAPAPVTSRAPPAIAQSTPLAAPATGVAPPTGTPAKPTATPAPASALLAATPSSQQPGGPFQERVTLAEQGGEFRVAAFSPDLRWLAVGDASGQTRLWSIEQSALRWSTGEPNNSVRGLAWSPDGQLLASSGLSGTVELRHAGDGTLQRTLENHGGPIEELAWSPDGQLLASADGKTLMLRRTSDGAEVWRIEDKGAYVHDLAFSPDGALLATAGEQGAVTLLNVEDGKVVRALAQRPGPMSSVAFSPDGKTLAAGSAAGTVELLHVDDGVAVRSIDLHSGPVWSTAFSPDGAYLAAASDDKHVRILRGGDGTLLQTLDTHDRSMHHLRFSADGKTLAAAGEQSTALFWQVGAGGS
jgi:WD40 repeat protein/serine/threonine protein kinase